ncbi:hypothetical protein G7Z17_g9151 [Cylindrodendrum hubeiense]|uniref:Uncharacterized protein n=1 Tax=Cylindrodendrum hubeiense TaxID=595255 RepID=A0A9P5LCI7_9HYPO|nr:hypothetical protein G7Z17_g9151 [Cylindrodendrum hubeiense]
MGRRATQHKVKLLLRWLKYCQLEDSTLSLPTMYLIRYTLKYNSRCDMMYFAEQEPPEPLPPHRDTDELPIFLYSQLEAQNLTNDRSLWKQVKPLLQFIRNHLPQPGHKGKYPTLFGWHSQDRHRTFWFFAFIEIEMEFRIYSARELLRMRHAPLSANLADNLWGKLQSDSDLVDVVRVPVSACRPLPLIKEEPREEKDSANTGHKIVANRVADRVAAPQLDGTDSEWKYVGRSDSENTETQPISAPPGLAAQKAEGFQRFYKAVVSPTHVRVTAGGRIVPNNRGSLSPTTKWTRERALGDVSAGSHPPTVTHSEIPPYPAQQPYGPFTPMMNGLALGMHSGMAPGPVHYPIMPAPMGYNMAGGYAMPPPAFSNFQLPKPAVNQSNSSSRSDKQSDGSGSDKQKPVCISPPEQFDHSRPFYFNGQWMMPNGHPFYPYNLMPPQGFQPAPMSTMMIPSNQSGVNTMIQNGVNSMAQNGVNSMIQTGFNPMVQNGVNGVNPGVQNGVKPMTQAAQPAQLVPSQTHLAPPTAAGSDMAHLQNPPISSIRPSEITKKQIESLRISMRYFEDQLQYNKHQIDEKATEQQAQMVRGQIEQFEKNLESQLAYESSHYPKAEAQNDDVHSTSSNGGNITGGPAKSDAEPNMPQPVPKEFVQAPATKISPVRGGGPTRAASGLNSTKSVSAFQPVKVKAELAIPNKEFAKKASSLPISAALAPPFQPRAPSTSTLATAIHAPQSTASSPDDEHHLANDHLVPPGGSGWRSFFKNSRSVIDLGGPYLVGRLPSGMKSEDATDSDYIYGRKLTKDERRARHMYWGKTPRSLQKGLPKFDGKDFYPPSPTKGSSSDSSTESVSPTSAADLENYPLGDELEQPEHSDPFQGMALSGLANIRSRLGDVTQSESLPPAENSMMGNYGPEIPRPFSCATQVSEVSRAFCQPGVFTHDSSSPSPPSLGSSEDSGKTDFKAKASPNDKSEDSDGALIFQGRQGMMQNGTKSRKSGNTILSTMLKKGKTSANVAPGKVSPTTAQGVLPNYAGHAAASLTPTIANTTPTPRGQCTKVGETNNIRSSTEKRVENRPPVDRRLDESRRGASRLGKGYRNMDSR